MPSTRRGCRPADFGADVVIGAVGRPETCRQAFYARDLAGTVVPAGVPTPEMRLELPPLDASVTETIARDEVEKAFERMRHGDVLRSVVVL
jgi:S-(hydroxymethyl)mycothiol dehydrogenase